MMPNIVRVDAVWERYNESSLKTQAHMRKEVNVGQRTWVSGNIQNIPKRGEWQKVLNDSKNMEQLFHFLTDELSKYAVNAHYHLITTKSDKSPQ